jgi:hypothetical protein
MSVQIIFAALIFIAIKKCNSVLFRCGRWDFYSACGVEIWLEARN